MNTSCLVAALAVLCTPRTTLTSVQETVSHAEDEAVQCAFTPPSGESVAEPPEWNDDRIASRDGRIELTTIAFRNAIDKIWLLGVDSNLHIVADSIDTIQYSNFCVLGGYQFTDTPLFRKYPFHGRWADVERRYAEAGLEIPETDIQAARELRWCRELASPQYVDIMCQRVSPDSPVFGNPHPWLRIPNPTTTDAGLKFENDWLTLSVSYVHAAGKDAYAGTRASARFVERPAVGANYEEHEYIFHQHQWMEQIARRLPDGKITHESYSKGREFYFREGFKIQIDVYPKLFAEGGLWVPGEERWVESPQEALTYVLLHEFAHAEAYIYQQSKLRQWSGEDSPLGEIEYGYGSLLRYRSSDEQSAWAFARDAIHADDR